MEQKLAEFRKSKTAEKQVPLYIKVLQGVNTKVNTLLLHNNNNNKKSDVKLGSTNQQASQNQVLVFCFFIF